MDIMRKRFTMGLAGHVIEIDTVSTCTCVLCMDYLCEGTPDIQIKVTDEDVQREASIISRKNLRPIDLINATAHRKVVEALLEHDFVLMHGAVVAAGNRGYMFSAPSGTGKTTHVRHWLRNLESSYIVNGDKPLVRVEDGKAVAYGTPWCGHEGMGRNAKVPLEAIVFLERSESNRIAEISFTKAYPRILQQTFMPHDQKAPERTLDLLSKLHNTTTFWHFACNN